MDWDIRTYFVFLSFCIYSTKCLSTTPATDEGGNSSVTEELPKIGITVGAIGIAIIIGLIVSKIADYCYDRQSLKDDASDMSDHTRQLLKARLTVLKFRSALAPKKKKKENPRQRAYRYARTWLQKTRARKRERDIEAGIIPADGVKDKKGITQVSVKTVDETAKLKKDEKIDLTSRSKTPPNKTDEQAKGVKNTKEKDKTDSKTNSTSPVLGTNVLPKSIQEETETSTTVTASTDLQTSSVVSPRSITSTPDVKNTSKTPSKTNKAQKKPDTKASSPRKDSQESSKKSKTDTNSKGKVQPTGGTKPAAQRNDSKVDKDNIKNGTTRPATATRPTTAGDRGNVSQGGRQPSGPVSNRPGTASASRPGTAVSRPGTAINRPGTASTKAVPGTAKRV